MQISGFQNPTALNTQINNLNSQNSQNPANTNLSADSENVNSENLAQNEPKIQNLQTSTQALEKPSDLREIAQNLDSENFDNLDLKPPRITYGLKVLELMSDEEYRAFLHASKDLSVSEKMQMAQGLYRFTDFYTGRKELENAQDAKIQANLRNYGIQNDQIQTFLNRYKNAYEQVLSGRF